MRATGFDSGKLYPILARLCHAGWLLREREEVDPTAAGRPARVFYRFSQPGAATARRALAAHASKAGATLPVLPFRWRPAGGIA